MIKLKSLYLVNFCGFRDFRIDFLDGKNIRQWTMLFGPNGSFKTSLLNAVEIISSPRRLKGRNDLTLFFRRLTYNSNYLPGYEGFISHEEDMRMEGIFLLDGKEKKVIIENTGDRETTGLITDELPVELQSVAYYVDADNPVNTQKFQIVARYKKEFLDFASDVYGFPCSVGDDPLLIVEEYDPQMEDYVEFITDFSITKYNNTKVHFKRFSAGEKKLATILNTLFNFVYKSKGNEKNILLVDNLDQHIYYKRHMKLIEKLTQYFPERQFISTTHSPVIIDKMDKKSLFDMEYHVG